MITKFLSITTLCIFALRPIATREVEYYLYRICSIPDCGRVYHSVRCDINPSIAEIFFMDKGVCDRHTEVEQYAGHNMVLVCKCHNCQTPQYFLLNEAPDISFRTILCEKCYYEYEQKFKPHYIIKKICYECQKDLGLIRFFYNPRKGTTSGLCLDCLGELEKRVDELERMP